VTTLTYTKEKAKALAVEDDVPSDSMKEIQRKDSNALEAEDDFPDSNSTSSFVPGPNQRAWWSFVGA